MRRAAAELFFERCGWLLRGYSLEIVGRVISMMERIRCCLGVMRLRCGVGVRMRLWCVCWRHQSKHTLVTCLATLLQERTSPTSLSLASPVAFRSMFVTKDTITNMHTSESYLHTAYTKCLRQHLPSSSCATQDRPNRTSRSCNLVGSLTSPGYSRYCTKPT